MPGRPLLLDTDIGTDVDDLLALALALNSPELELVGVTCVYGDVDLRARIVARALDLFGGVDHVPVVRGAREPLLRTRPVYWAGHEGEGLNLDSPVRVDEGHAVDSIVDTVRARPGAVHLVAIGPLTNVALAFAKDPAIAGQLHHLTIMGGALRGPDGLHLPYAEHNLRSDPEAAHIVLTSGAPITLVPLDVTRQVTVTPAGVASIRAAGSPFQLAVADQIERYPPFAGRGFTNLHDPLALATAIRPELVQTRRVQIDVLTTGVAAGATLMREPTGDDPTVDVALTVDAAAFEAFFLERLTRR